MGVRKAATPRLVSPRTGVGGTGGPAGMRLRPRPGSGASWHSHRLVATFRWIIDVFTKLLNPRLMIRYTLNNPCSTKETVPVPVPETCVSRMNFIPTKRTFISTVQYLWCQNGYIYSDVGSLSFYAETQRIQPISSTHFHFPSCTKILQKRNK